MKNKKTRVAAAVAVATGAAWLAMTAPAFPMVSSVSPPATLDIQSQATYQAKGARIIVPVEIACPAGADETYAHIVVSQSVNARAITTAETEFGVICDGTARTINLSLTPSPKAFKKGVAAASVHFYASHWGWGWWDPDWHLSLDDDEVVTIK
jgi:hypothetical protein